MYLVSIYFDEKTNQKIQYLINRIAKKSGNFYMLEGEVPPHITISAFETDREEEVIKRLNNTIPQITGGTLKWASLGSFPPYVLFLAPVLSEYLHCLSSTIYDCVSMIDGVSVSRYYRPFQWMPHTTVAKKLEKDEMALAYTVLQEQFRMISGQVVRIGLAKTNPYRDIISWDLTSS